MVPRAEIVVLAAALLLVAGAVYLTTPARAAGATAADLDPSRTMRLVVDPTTNHYPALERFLERKGYWPEEREAVLAPLNGRLSLGHDTAAVRLVESLDDIPGLRPLPAEVYNFMRGHHNVFYLEVGDDRLLLGVSHVFRGQVSSPEDFYLETLDLVTGAHEDLGTARHEGPALAAFLAAHGPFLGGFLRTQLFWVVFMLFLAWRLRRLRSADGDPVVNALRVRVAARLFVAAGLVWCVQLAATLGLMQFQGSLRFLEGLAGGASPGFRLLREQVLQPQTYRLLSLVLSLTLSLGWLLLLGLWAGLLGGGGGARPGAGPGGGRAGGSAGGVGAHGHGVGGGDHLGRGREGEGSS